MAWKVLRGRIVELLFGAGRTLSIDPWIRLRFSTMSNIILFFLIIIYA
jgi:hypothetical protein